MHLLDTRRYRRIFCFRVLKGGILRRMSRRVRWASSGSYRRGRRCSHRRSYTLCSRRNCRRNRCNCRTSDPTKCISLWGKICNINEHNRATAPALIQISMLVKTLVITPAYQLSSQNHFCVDNLNEDQNLRLEESACPPRLSSCGSCFPKAILLAIPRALTNYQTGITELDFVEFS